MNPDVAAATVGSIPRSRNNGLSIIPPPSPKYPAMNPPITEFLDNLFNISPFTIKSSEVLSLNFSLISLTLLSLFTVKLNIINPIII